MLFFAWWLLPGVVLGVVGTLLAQAAARTFHMMQVTKCRTSSDVEAKAKTSDRLTKLSDPSNRRIEAGDEYLCYLSGTKRVHKTPTCSNMTKCDQVQLCTKCFKLS